MRRIGVPLLLVLTACAPLGEQGLAEREYQRGEFRARFIDFREACQAEGGTIVIRSRRRVGADRMPRPGDHYHCEMP